jgi:hypothetical protein
MKTVNLDVKTAARMINRGLVQTYAAIDRGDMKPVPNTRPMLIPITEVERYRQNMPRRGPKRKGNGNKRSSEHD